MGSHQDILSTEEHCYYSLKAFADVNLDTRVTPLCRKNTLKDLKEVHQEKENTETFLFDKHGALVLPPGGNVLR